MKKFFQKLRYAQYMGNLNNGNRADRRKAKRLAKKCTIK